MKPAHWAVVLAITWMVAPDGDARAAAQKLTLVTDVATGVGPGTTLDWRPGAGRVLGEWRAGAVERAYLYVPGPAAVSAAAGRLTVRFGTGGGGFAADPTRRLDLAPATGRGILGGALQVRRGGMHLLAVAGADSGRPAGVFGADLARGGVVLGLVRDRRPRLAAALRFGRGRQRCTIDGRALPAPAIACELRAPVALGDAALDLRVPESATVVPAGGPAIGYSPGLELALRRTRGGLSTTFGVHAELRSTAQALAPPELGRARRRQAFGDATLTLAPDRHARLRAEWRGDDQPGRARVRAEWRSALASTAVDWTSGGGVLVQVRVRWALPARIMVEAGSAAWNGPVAETGATLDLPAVPSHTVAPRFARPGHQTGVLIDWQVRRFRVRLGWTTRQRRYELPDGLFAARMELVGPR